jgi:hypothetical protein
MIGRASETDGHGKANSSAAFRFEFLASPQADLAGILIGGAGNVMDCAWIT